MSDSQLSFKDTFIGYCQTKSQYKKKHNLYKQKALECVRKL